MASATVASAIAYALKKSFDRTIDLAFERLKEANKMQIQEASRRGAFVYDRQFETLKTVLSLTYRLRNVMREVLSLNDTNDPKKVRELINRFEGYCDGLTELLYEERAILPEKQLVSLHDFKSAIHSLHSFRDMIQEVQEMDSSDSVDENEVRKFKSFAQEQYDRADRLFEKLDKAVHNKLGIEE